MKLPLGQNFYVMRHAQTEDNVNQVVSGSARVTVLTDEGKRQATEMQQLLEKIDPPIDRVIISEMQRTIDTAKLACDHDKLRHLPHTQDKGLNERAYGAAEGMSDKERDKIKASGGGIAGQESKDSLRDRTFNVISQELEKGGVPLFVTHGGNIRRVLEETIGKDKVEGNVGRIPNSVLLEFVSPKRDGGGWKVNVVTLDDNKEIKRRHFGDPASMVGKINNNKSGREIT